MRTHGIVRRVCTPLDRVGRGSRPRQLHPSHYGFLCPTVGIVSSNTGSLWVDQKMDKPSTAYVWGGGSIRYQPFLPHDELIAFDRMRSMVVCMLQDRLPDWDGRERTPPACILLWLYTEWLEQHTAARHWYINAKPRDASGRVHPTQAWRGAQIVTAAHTVLDLGSGQLKYHGGDGDDGFECALDDADRCAVRDILVPARDDWDEALLEWIKTTKLGPANVPYDGDTCTGNTSWTRSKRSLYVRVRNRTLSKIAAGIHPTRPSATHRVRIPGGGGVLRIPGDRRGRKMHRFPRVARGGVRWQPEFWERIVTGNAASERSGVVRGDERLRLQRRVRGGVSGDARMVDVGNGRRCVACTPCRTHTARKRVPRFATPLFDRWWVAIPRAETQSIPITVETPEGPPGRRRVAAAAARRQPVD